jgi:hypothetical protein
MEDKEPDSLAETMRDLIEASEIWTEELACAVQTLTDKIIKYD